jgi:hypothetical protein
MYLSNFATFTEENSCSAMHTACGGQLATHLVGNFSRHTKFLFLYLSQKNIAKLHFEFFFATPLSERITALRDTMVLIFKLFICVDQTYLIKNPDIDTISSR